MSIEEEKDIKQFYKHFERVIKILLEELIFVNVNGYIIIDTKKRNGN